MLSQVKLDIVASYCIPPEEVEEIKLVECHSLDGVFTYVVTMRDGEYAWNGCGQFGCSQCKYCAADGLVGDDAIRKYWEAWSEKMWKGESVPSYVRKVISHPSLVAEW